MTSSVSSEVCGSAETAHLKSSVWLYPWDSAANTIPSLGLLDPNTIPWPLPQTPSSLLACLSSASCFPKFVQSHPSTPFYPVAKAPFSLLPKDHTHRDLGCFGDFHLGPGAYLPAPFTEVQGWALGPPEPCRSI